jgi:DNA-binding winged helix-turn-helix (wHTH) protein
MHNDPEKERKTPSSGLPRVYFFDGFTLSTPDNVLRRPDSSIALTGRPCQVLSFLLGHHGQVKTRNEILDAIWGDEAVTLNTVDKAVSQVRKALGDPAATRLVTIPRHGYLFQLTFPEEAFDEAVEQLPHPEPSERQPKHESTRVVGEQSSAALDSRHGVAGVDTGSQAIPPAEDRNRLLPFLHRWRFLLASVFILSVILAIITPRLWIAIPGNPIEYRVVDRALVVYDEEGRPL